MCINPSCLFLNIFVLFQNKMPFLKLKAAEQLARYFTAHHLLAGKQQIFSKAQV